MFTTKYDTKIKRIYTMCTSEMLTVDTSPKSNSSNHDRVTVQILDREREGLNPNRVRKLLLRWVLYLTALI